MSNDPEIAEDNIMLEEREPAYAWGVFYSTRPNTNDGAVAYFWDRNKAFRYARLRNGKKDVGGYFVGAVSEIPEGRVVNVPFS